MFLIEIFVFWSKFLILVCLFVCFIIDISSQKRWLIGILLVERQTIQELNLLFSVLLLL